MRPNQSISAAWPRRMKLKPGAIRSASGGSSGNNTESLASGDQIRDASTATSATRGKRCTNGIGCTSRNIGGRRLAIHQSATGQAGKVNHSRVLA